MCGVVCGVVGVVGGVVVVGREGGCVPHAPSLPRPPQTPPLFRLGGGGWR